MDPSILINWTSPFPILGVPGVLFHFYSISNRYSCQQTVKTLITRRCGVWSGSSLFADVPKWDSMLKSGLMCVTSCPLFAGHFTFCIARGLVKVCVLVLIRILITSFEAKSCMVCCLAADSCVYTVFVSEYLLSCLIRVCCEDMNSGQLKRKKFPLHAKPCALSQMPKKSIWAWSLRAHPWQWICVVVLSTATVSYTFLSDDSFSNQSPNRRWCIWKRIIILICQSLFWKPTVAFVNQVVS